MKFVIKLTKIEYIYNLVCESTTDNFLVFIYNANTVLTSMTHPSVLRLIHISSVKAFHFSWANITDQIQCKFNMPSLLFLH